MADMDLAYYLSLPYTKVLKRDDDGATVATISELDGCIAEGLTEADALANLREAQNEWLEHAITAGRDIPVPEIEEELPSGKVLLRLPRSLHQKLIKFAKRDDVSLNQLIVMAAAEHASRREGRQDMKDAYATLVGVSPAPLKWNREEPASSMTLGKYFETVKQRGVIKSTNEEKEAHPPMLPKVGRRG